MRVERTERRAVLSDMRAALGRERHVLLRYPDLLWQQVYNGIRARSPSPSTTALLDECASRGPRLTTPWFRQMWAPPDVAEIVLQSHTDWVLAVAASQSAARVLTGGRDGLLCLWDAASGRLVATLDNHGGWVYDCALYDRDRRALSCGGDRLAQIWNLETFALEAAFEHPEEVRGCAVHEGRGLFATACYDGGVRMGTLEQHRLVWGARAHMDRANTVAFTPDGGLVISGGRDGALCVIDVGTGAVLHRADAGSSCFRVAMCPDGSRFAVSHANGDVSLWHVDGLREAARVRGAHRGEAVGCAVSPDGSLVASTGSDASVALWSTDQRLAPRTRLSGHGNAVFACAFLANDRLVTGSADGNARIVSVGGDVRAPATDLERPLCDGPVFSVAAEPGGTVLAMDGRGTACRVDPVAGDVVARVRLDIEPGPVHVAPALEADGLIAVGCPDGEVRLVEPESLEVVGGSPCHGGWVTSCTWLPGGRELLTTGVDGAVTISRRVFGGGLLPRASISFAPKQVQSAAWMSDSRVLVGVGGRLATWDPITGERDSLPIGDAAVPAAVVLPSGIAVAVLGDGRVAILRDALADAKFSVACARPALRAVSDSAWGVWSAYSLGHRWVAIGATHGVTVWDVIEREVIARVPTSGDIYGVCVVELPERTLLCTGDTSGHVSVFELRGTTEGSSND